MVRCAQISRSADIRINRMGDLEKSARLMFNEPTFFRMGKKFLVDNNQPNPLLGIAI